MNILFLRRLCLALGVNTPLPKPVKAVSQPRNAKAVQPEPSVAPLSAPARQKSRKSAKKDAADV